MKHNPQSSLLSLTAVLREFGVKVTEVSEKLFTLSLTPKWDKKMNLSALLMNFYKFAERKIKKLRKKMTEELCRFQVGLKQGLMILSCKKVGNNQYELQFS